MEKTREEKNSVEYFETDEDFPREGRSARLGPAPGFLRNQSPPNYRVHEKQEKQKQKVKSMSFVRHPLLINNLRLYFRFILLFSSDKKWIRIVSWPSLKLTTWGSPQTRSLVRSVLRCYHLYF